MADYFTEFACRLDVGTPENVQRAIAIYSKMDAALERDEGVAIGFELEADPTAPGSLVISDDGGAGEPEHVLAFALRCAEAFDLSGRWGFTWGLTCSLPRLDGFGGGAHVLDLATRKTIAWMDCEHWLIAMLDPNTRPDEGIAFG